MKKPNDNVRFLLTALFAAWIIAFLYAFLAYMTTAPDGMSFSRGLNRVKLFLGWQGVAGVLAIAIFGVSLQWPEGAAVRQIARVPLIIAILLVLAIVGILLWASQSG